TPDLNPDDDTAAQTTIVIGQSADLAIGVVGSPNPVMLGQDLTYFITVSNLGPGSATSVAVIDTLPPGVAFVSASPARYTLVDRSLTFTNLGTVGNGQDTTVSIVVRPTEPALLTNSVACASPILDPRKLNNSGSVKTVVDTLQIGVLRLGGNLQMSWPEAGGDYSLEYATNLIAPVVWTPVTNSVNSVNGYKVVTVPIGNGNQFFRLRPQTP
ncbi:MAG: DUF11 domain-containing protein, partial [Planctomycetaceae bacterium]